MNEGVEYDTYVTSIQLCNAPVPHEGPILLKMRVAYLALIWQWKEHQR